MGRIGNVHATAKILQEQQYLKISYKFVISSLLVFQSSTCTCFLHHQPTCTNISKALLCFICVQWTLRITDTLVHRPLSVIRGVSFIGVFCLSHITLHLNSSLIIILLSTMYYYKREFIHDPRNRLSILVKLLPTELTSVSAVERSI